jgi:hypothetical protein
MMYRLFGFWIRREACRLSALAMQGEFSDGAIASRLWALTVFFESYMLEGADGTMEEFGPKEPVPLQAVEGSAEQAL